MKLIRRMLSSILVVVLFMSITLTAFAAHSFCDVDKNSWYGSAVDYVYNKGLMSGVSSEVFSPDASMSRAMLVTVLYRMAGKPYTSATEPFVDVVSSDWFYKPVVWAYSNGIVSGTSPNTFYPDNNITREQMVAIFAKYAAYKGLKTPASANLNGYNDRFAISSYATAAFKWAVGAGIISGTSPNTLGPQGYATRAQCAVIIRQFVQWAEGGNVVNPTPTPTPTPVPTVKPGGSYGDTETGEDEF